MPSRRCATSRSAAVGPCVTTRARKRQRPEEDEDASDGKMAGTLRRRAKFSQGDDKARRQAVSGDPESKVPNDVGNEEQIDEDHICPVCQRLLYDPIRTRCNHVLCRTCMATWAEVSIASQMIIVPVDEVPEDFDAAADLEAKCPMCRTQTSASLDEGRAKSLEQTYPRAYAERRTEEGAAADEQSIQSLTLHIGNTHELIPSADDFPNNHRWTFFVRPSRTDILEEVQIFLHPTFRPSRIIRSRPPYAIQRTGWGIFTITSAIILRAGYSWVSSDAEDSPDGAENGMLRLEWILDFTSYGGKVSMRRCRLKVKNDRDGEWGEVSDDEERDRAEWQRMVRGYERDGRWEPEEEGE